MGVEQAVALIKSLEISVEAAILDDLWLDLEKKALTNPVPPEHIALLDERLDKIESGKVTYTDWQTLKAKLLDGKAH